MWEKKRRSRRYPLLGGSDNDAAGQSILEHVVRLEVSGCSGEGREAGQTQLEARRRRLGWWGRRLRRQPLHDVTGKHSKLWVAAVLLDEHYNSHRKHWKTGTAWYSL